MSTNTKRFHKAVLHAFVAEGQYTTNRTKETVQLADGRLFAFNGYDRFYEIGTGNDVIEVKL